MELPDFLRRNGWTVAWLVLVLVGLSLLLIYKLGSLTGGLSAGEVATSIMPVGWHGIYHQTFYLPLKVVRSVVFASFTRHGQSLTRLPNTLFGGLAIISFVWLISLWHSRRTAVLAGLLFATSAWTLHVSRLASFDVLYLWATPTLILIHYLLQKYSDRSVIWYGSSIIWGIMLYIPGLIWFIGVSVFLQRQALVEAWQDHSSWWQRLLYVLAGLIWLPLLVINLLRSGNLLLWLGWPAHIASLGLLVKHFVAVPAHLFIRGPQYPDLWLGRVPILNIFTLAVCLIGIYFYAAHWRATRSRLLGLYGLIGLILVGLAGPVSLSLLVPLLYMAAATGITYLLHEWLQTFPRNPLARGLGVSLITIAVVLSCIYNLRAYFVAWPHNPVTIAIFRYHR